MHDGLLYIQSPFAAAASTTLVLNPATGKLVRTLPDSDGPIAFDGNTGIFTLTPLNEPSNIRAVNLTTGAIEWTHILPVTTVPRGGGAMEPSTLRAAPLIENGSVWISYEDNGADLGQIGVLNEVTGKPRSIITTACNASTGQITIAQHRVFVSSDCGIETYTN